MTTSQDIQEMRKKRFVFLRKCYEVSEGSTLQIFEMWKVGEELGFDRKLTGVVTEYLDGEDLIKYTTLGGGISITHRGIVEIEQALGDPDEPTDHFPPLNVIYVGQMIDSQIQQASPAAAQVTFREGKDEELRALVESLSNSIEEFGLDDQEKSDLQAEILTIEAQTSKSKPNRTIIAESLRSIRTILEQAAGAALAVGFIEVIKTLVQG
jgi:hypothetical protein